MELIFYLTVSVVSSQLSLVLLVATAAAAPQFRDQSFVSSGQPQVRILSQRFDADEAGNYEYGYEQDNGQEVW